MCAMTLGSFFKSITHYQVNASYFPGLEMKNPKVD